MSNSNVQSDRDNVRNTFCWSIENYTSACARNSITLNCAETPTNVMEFKLILHANNNQYLTANFVPKNSCKKQVKCKVCVWIPAAKEKSKSFTTLTLPESVQFSLIETTKLLNNSNNLLPDNILTIACDIIILMPPIQVPESKLVDDLGALLEEETLSDVTIVTGDGQNINAHRLILSARSPVFMAMFKHSTKEKELGFIKITDFNYNVIKEMLRYIYTDQKPNMADIAEDLITAANKYSLDRLEAMCADFIISNLSVQNAARVLKLADLLNIEYLKSRAVEFIKINIDDVWDTQEWMQLLQINPYFK